MGKVAIDNIPSLNPTGTINIVENGVVNVAPYASANVQVSGMQLVDVNPEKIIQHGSYTLLLPSSSSNYYITFPVQGYSSIAFAKADSSITLKYYFDLNDGTSTSVTTLTLSQNIWSSDIDIPDNAMFIKLASASGNASLQYTMKA